MGGRREGGEGVRSNMRGLVGRAQLTKGRAESPFTIGRFRFVSTSTLTLQGGLALA